MITEDRLSGPITRSPDLVSGFPDQAAAARVLLLIWLNAGLDKRSSLHLLNACIATDRESPRLPWRRVGLHLAVVVA